MLFFDDFGALFADRPAEGGIELRAAMRRHVVDGRVRVVGELTERRARSRGAPRRLADRRDAARRGRGHRRRDDDRGGKAWAAHWAQQAAASPAGRSPGAIPTAVDLARRYLPYRAFPGKAVRLLEELRVAHDHGRDAGGTGKLLGERELYAAFSWTTGIPVALLPTRRPLRSADVVARAAPPDDRPGRGRERVAEAMCVAKARLQPGDKPLASLFFVGPERRRQDRARAQPSRRTCSARPTAWSAST